MPLSFRTLAIVLPAALALSGCAAELGMPGAPQSLALELTHSADRQVTADYRVSKATMALHFPQELGGYRAEVWRPADSAFRWVKEGEGERIERTDGQAFRQSGPMC